MVGKSRIWGAKIQDALPRVTPAAGEGQSRGAVSPSPTHACWPLHSECLHAAGARCGGDHHHQCGRAARRVRMFRHARRPPRHNKPRSSGRPTDLEPRRDAARDRPATAAPAGTADQAGPGRHRGPGIGTAVPAWPARPAPPSGIGMHATAETRQDEKHIIGTAAHVSACGGGASTCRERCSLLMHRLSAAIVVQSHA